MTNGWMDWSRHFKTWFLGLLCPILKILYKLSNENHLESHLSLSLSLSLSVYLSLSVSLSLCLSLSVSLPQFHFVLWFFLNCFPSQYLCFFKFFLFTFLSWVKVETTLLKLHFFLFMLLSRNCQSIHFANFQ